MALSSRPKSNSSASKAPKPTFRRAPRGGSAAAGASSVAPAPAPKPAAKPKAKPATAPRPKAKPVAKPQAKPVAKPKAKPVAKPVRKPVAKPQAQAPQTVRPQAAPASAPKAAAPASTLRAAQTPQKASRRRASKLPAPLRPIASALSGGFRAIGSALSHIPLPRLGRGLVLGILGVIVLLIIAAFALANSSVFAATDIQIKGSEHVEQETVEVLVDIPSGTTLLNVNETSIVDSLKANPWIAGVGIEREWPHTLVISPVEHKVNAIAFITADEIAWSISEEGTWIAPMSLVVAVDSEGNEVALNEDGSVPEGATQLSAFEAASRLADQTGALMLVDVPSDVNPKSGEDVRSSVVLAGLQYSREFSPEFMAQIKSLSVASEESISATFKSGIEVSLGEPENITEKERVVTKLLEERQGVTYINVREPGAYTFRGAPQ